MIDSSQEILAYDIAGPVDALPIMFIHGAAWTRKMWVPQMETLAREFRVIAVDLPGHGVRRGQPFQLAPAVQSVMESLRRETQKRALIVGLSLGGYVAMACAHDQAQDIAGLVLSGCCLDYRGAIGFLCRLDSIISTTLFSDSRITQIQEKALRRLLPDNIIEPQLAAGFSWKAMPQIYRELASHDFYALLRTYTGPVLIINGENDKPNRKREMEFSRATQDGQVQIIQQASHLCNLEQPKVFSQQVYAMAQRLSAASKA